MRPPNAWSSRTMCNHAAPNTSTKNRWCPSIARAIACDNSGATCTLTMVFFFFSRYDRSGHNNPDHVCITYGQMTSPNLTPQKHNNSDKSINCQLETDDTLQLYNPMD